MKAAALLLSILAMAAGPAEAETLQFGRFGPMTLYPAEGAAREVVLFFSGEAGWNPGVVSMAQHLAAQGAAVVGIDLRHYLQALEDSNETCVSPATDLEDLGRYVESNLQLKGYLQPMLAGYASGGTLVYGALAESLDGQFKGALSLNFRPQLELKKPLCSGQGLASESRRDAAGELTGVNLLPAKSLPGKWIALQGQLDPVASAPAIQKFVKAVPGAQFVMLPKTGQDYDVPKRWQSPFDAAFHRIAGKSGPSQNTLLADLPLTVVPASPIGHGPWFGIFLTGDGGWVGFDRGVSKELARHDIPIVGWDSLKYFWSARTPDSAAHDLDRVLRYYSQSWHRSHVLLIGFSQGADTLPFMQNRLPPDTQRMVGFTTLMGISDNALFQFHVANWLGQTSGSIPTAPELEHWSGAPYLCMFGESDADAACAQLVRQGGEVLQMPGDHHLGNRYVQIAAEILGRMPAL